MDIGEDEIRRWHKNKKWSDIGYNIVIRRNGRVEVGRPLDHRGAHVAGYNNRALGICLIGGMSAEGTDENNFTPEQWLSLEDTLKWLRRVYPGAHVQGHREFPGVTKTCPCFNVWEKLIQWGIPNEAS